ncbi:MAG: DUF3592 domain-containing protein [Ktedonobacteraceae bacterium]
MLITADIFVLIVVICLLVIGFLLWTWQARVSSRLAHHGKLVTATIISIEKRHSYKLTYYTVVARWTDPQKHTTYTFESEPEPRPPLEQYTEGSPVAILIDPANPNSYHMEIERRKADI